MTMDFHTVYRAWLDACLAEFNAGEYGDGREYHQESAPKDYVTGLLVEFTEDGDAYPHGIGGIGHIRQAVTPWETWDGG
jgi:hypothetical protein